MILVGEVKEIAPARSGHKLVIKHMPGFVFLIDDALQRRLQSRFETELMLWGSDASSHLIAIATFALTPSGLAIADELALMVVAENWVPYESLYEKKLVDALAKLSTRSVKGLRFNLPADRPIAVATLQSEVRPLGLYIVPLVADTSHEEALAELISSRPDMDAWTWRVSDGEMPPLPARPA